MATPWRRWCLTLLALGGPLLVKTEDPRLSDERCVFQTKYGDVEFAFMPDVAPITAPHIYRLVQLGLFTQNHIFRVDKGFVAQVADVVGNRPGLEMDERQKVEGPKRVPLEVKEGVKHVEGVLSMGRFDDPNSGESSFSFLLGNAPHLDMQYTIFGKVTKGMETLHKLEGLPTRKEGIFIMPLERITILASYCYVPGHTWDFGQLSKGASADAQKLRHQIEHMRKRFHHQEEELQRVRLKCLPH